MGVLKEENIEKYYKKGNGKNNGPLLYDLVADNTAETKTGQVTENKGVQKAHEWKWKTSIISPFKAHGSPWKR